MGVCRRLLLIGERKAGWLGGGLWMQVGGFLPGKSQPAPLRWSRMLNPILRAEWRDPPGLSPGIYVSEKRDAMIPMAHGTMLGCGAKGWNSVSFF